MKKCKKRTIADYEYGDVIKISDIPGIQPIGYVVRIPIYVLASRNAHIRFSEDYIVYLNRDDVYEFVIGAGEVLKVSLFSINFGTFQVNT